MSKTSLLETLRQEPGQLGTAWSKLTEEIRKELDDVVAAYAAGDLPNLSIAKIFRTFTDRYPAHRMSEMTFRRMWDERLRYHGEHANCEVKRNGKSK